ncbi:RING finger and WD repeat domain-containing protein 3 [Coemansia asiatica]|nr:RING finger and WD repeat domain-containing protein 3 [Coemansia asiatica]
MSLDSVDAVGTDNAAVMDERVDDNNTSIIDMTGIADISDSNICRVRKRHRIQQSLSEKTGLAAGARLLDNSIRRNNSVGDEDKSDEDQEFQPKGSRSSHLVSSKPLSFFPQISTSTIGMAIEQPLHAQSTQQNGHGAEDDDASESSTCPICLDTWGISGSHRVVALKCGHLFGQSCVRKWLMQGGRKSSAGSGLSKGKCPECNQAATKRDMRPIFARSIVAIDDGRLSELQKEVDRLARRARELEADVAHYQLKYMQMRNEVKRARDEHEVAFKRVQVLELQNAALEKRLAEDSLDIAIDNALGETADKENKALANQCLEEMANLANIESLDKSHRKLTVPVFRLCSTTQVARGANKASSRVLAVDPHEPAVYASCSNSAANVHTMFRIDVGSKEPVPFALPSIHKDEIRGAEISPFQSDTRYLLTASMDQTAALTMLACVPATCKSSAPLRCSPVVTARLNVGVQAWSCAWDACDPNKCYIGTAGGRVLAFDLRWPSEPQMVWDGPRSGAVHDLAPDQPVAAPNYSPIHSMVVIRLTNKEEGAGASSSCRLVVANAQRIYALPERPEDRWIWLSDNMDDKAGRSCLSISYDARTSCVGASFRASDEVNGRTTEHELYEIRFEPLLWRRRRRISVPSAQNRWARSTAFSCHMALDKKTVDLSLFGAAVEASRCVRLWDVADPRVREVVSLDVAAPEDIVDVRAGQWCTDNEDHVESDRLEVSPAFVFSLSTSSLRIYQIE